MEKLSTTTVAALKEKKRRRHLPLVFITVSFGLAAVVWRNSAKPAAHPIGINQLTDSGDT